MNYKKLIFAFVAVFVGTFALTQNALAQDTSPVLYIKNVVVSNQDVNVGATLTGTFDISNESTVPAGNASYAVSLVGTNGILDEKMIAVPDLGANQTKKINWSYTLPKNIAGDVTLTITAKLQNGISQGWEDVKINIKGTVAPETLSFSNLAVQVASSTFAPQAGPTVGKDEGAKVTLTVKNSANTSVDIVPTTVINNYNDSGKQVSKIDGIKITVGAKSSEKVALNLPTFNGKAGVYEGTLTFTDTTGLRRSPILNFRYIVEGATATIIGVGADKTTAILKTGEQVTVKVTYTGTAVDITSDPTSDNASAPTGTMKVELSSGGVVVGTSETSVTLSSVEQVKAFPIVLSANTNGLSAKVTVVSGGKTITSYESVISKAETATPTSTTSSNMIWFVLGIVVLLVVVFFVALKMMKKNTPPSNPPMTPMTPRNPMTPPTSNPMNNTIRNLVIALAIVGAGALVSATVYAGYYSFAEPGTRCNGKSCGNASVTTPTGIVSATMDATKLHYPALSTDWCQLCAGVNMFINSIKNTNGTTYTLVSNNIVKGKPFVLSGYTVYQACGNFGLNPNIQYSVDGGSLSANILGAGATTQSGYYRTSNFTLPSITFSTTGSHKVHIKFTADRDYNSATNVPGAGCKPQKGGYLCPATIVFETDLNVTVVEPPTLTASCSANKTTAKVGQNATWSATGVTGGIGSYTYSWTGTKTGTGSSVTSDSFTTTGTKTESLTITSGSQTITPTCPSVAVSEVVVTPTGTALGGTCTATASQVVSGGEATWTANPTGGNGTYTYSWNSGAFSSNSTYSENITASTQPTLVIKSNGVEFSPTSGCPTVTVGDTPAVPLTCSAPDSTSYVGKPVIWTINTGFVDGKSYEWTGTDISNPPLIKNTQSVVKIYSKTGTKRMYVREQGSTIEPVECAMPVGGIKIQIDPGFNEN